MPTVRGSTCPLDRSADGARYLYVPFGGPHRSRTPLGPRDGSGAAPRLPQVSRRFALASLAPLGEPACSRRLRPRCPQGLRPFLQTAAAPTARSLASSRRPQPLFYGVPRLFGRSRRLSTEAHDADPGKSLNCPVAPTIGSTPKAWAEGEGLRVGASPFRPCVPSACACCGAQLRRRRPPGATHRAQVTTCRTQRRT